MSSSKPLGIFWDTNSCCLPITMSTNECLKHLRDFISNQLTDNCIEYQFTCLSNQLNDSIIQCLQSNGCHILDIRSNETNILLQFHERVEQFVDNYGFDSVLVLISNNRCLSPTIRLAKRKEVTVIVISDQISAKELITTVDQSYGFTDVFGLNRIVTLSVTNLPKNKSRKVIRDSFEPFCHQFNCKFRFNGRQNIKLEFINAIEAKKAETRLNELEFFGQELFVKTEDSNRSVSPTLTSSDCSLASMASPGMAAIPPHNDDNCKSVLIGLYSKSNEHVLKLVRDLVRSWNVIDINESNIIRVNREREFIGRDGKASLIVTVTDFQTNERLLFAAKTRFVNRFKKHYWNRLQRSKKDFNGLENQSNGDNSDIGTDCKSKIVGLWTRYDENVIKTVRKLVKGWNLYDFDIKQIVCVERSKKYLRRDGKADLIVSTNSAESTKRLISYAENKRTENLRFYWKPIETKLSVDLNESQTNSSQESSDYSANQTQGTAVLHKTYASIANQSIVRDKELLDQNVTTNTPKTSNASSFNFVFSHKRKAMKNVGLFAPFLNY